MRKIINLMFALAAVAFLSATLNAQPVVKPKSFTRAELTHGQTLIMAP